MAPYRSGWLSDAFQDATLQPLGYLQIDNYLRTAVKQRIRTRILPFKQARFYVERQPDEEDNQAPPAKPLPSNVSPHHAPAKRQRQLKEHKCDEYKSKLSHVCELMGFH